METILACKNGMYQILPSISLSKRVFSGVPSGLRMTSVPLDRPLRILVQDRQEFALNRLLPPLRTPLDWVLLSQIA